MPASLFEHRPSVCPFGHDLAPGRVSVGFSPCVCALAREAAAHGGSMGHLRLHCLACEGEGRSSIFLEPPCDVRHREQLGGWQLTRDPAFRHRHKPQDAGRLRLRLEVIDKSIGSALVLRGLQQGFVGLSVIGVAVVMHTKLDAAVAAQALGNDALGSKLAIRYPRRRPFATGGCGVTRKSILSVTLRIIVVWDSEPGGVNLSPPHGRLRRPTHPVVAGYAWLLATCALAAGVM